MPIREPKPYGAEDLGQGDLGRASCGSDPDRPLYRKTSARKGRDRLALSVYRLFRTEVKIYLTDAQSYHSPILGA